MKRFIIYSGVLILGLLTAALAEAAEMQETGFPQVQDIQAPGGDAMTYFASGQHRKVQAEATAAQLQNIEPAAGPVDSDNTSTGQAPAKASIQGRAGIYVEQGKVESVTEDYKNYEPCSKSSAPDGCAQGPEVEKRDAAAKSRKIPAQTLDDQAPAVAKSTVAREKVRDVKTGVKTNIIMNTDTGVDISR